jgi:hypothetical protein
MPARIRAMTPRNGRQPRSRRRIHCKEAGPAVIEHRVGHDHARHARYAACL